MKHKMLLTALALSLALNGLAWADTQNQKKATTAATATPSTTTCVRDHDKDGVPNCIDPDWQRPLDGTGYRNGQGNQGNGQGRSSFNRNNRQSWGGQFCTGTGVCDGTGPHGRQSGRGRR
jgi:hypothetical protein